MASVDQLKRRLAGALKAGHVEAALRALTTLSRQEPADPRWPWRTARLLRRREDPHGALAALRHTLDLQVDQSRVLDAIATCKAILELAPDDEEALQRLDLLYQNGHSGSVAPTRGDEDRFDDGSGDAVRDEPLDTLLLSDLVPGAHAVPLADARPGSVNEIPVDPAVAAEDEATLDLQLDASVTPRQLRDLAAARIVALPSGARAAPRRTGPRPVEAPHRSLGEELANVPLFGDLDPTSLHALIRRVKVVSLEAGEILFRQGDPANSLYVVVDGAVVPIAEGNPRRKLAVLERGSFFGEIGLMTKQPRNATIEALVETRLLVIDRPVLWGLIDREPGVARSLVRFLRLRLIDRQMRTSPFFAAFAHAEREAVARQFRVLEVTDGTRVVEQGRPPEGLFVVLSGSLARVDRQRRKRLGELGLGDVFGGLSLLEGQPAANDVVAQGKCWLVVLGEGRFRRIVEANPRLVPILRRLGRERAGDAEDRSEPL